MKSTLKRRTYMVHPDDLSAPSSPNSEQEGNKVSNSSKSMLFTDRNGNPDEEKYHDNDRFSPEVGGFNKNVKSTSPTDKYVLLILIILSFITRWYKIGWGNRPIWDEAHFGKFGSFYLRRYFHHDVHPPLAKMLIALAGKIAGYDGSFDFTKPEQFPSDMNHGLMRKLVSIFGIAIVPISFLTTRSLGLSKRCQYLTSFMVLFDNGFIVISKFLLLDPFLLCFSSMTLYFWSEFYNERKRPFSKSWWYNLILLGISMGLNCGVKWGVPLFLVTTIGLFTIQKLWTFKTHSNLDLIAQSYHWFARVLCLIVIPAIIYLLAFKVNFMILNSTGEDDYSMDSIFISKLNGTGLENNSLDVAFGANVTLRATILNGGVLHSQENKYPEGSKEQQVSAHREPEFNNYWIVKDPINKSHEKSNSSTAVNLLKNGSIIQLIHCNSSMALTVQPEYDAPKSGSKAYEVSASKPQNNSRTYWKIIVYDDRQHYLPINSIHTITTRIKLLNPESNCLLASSDTHLPKSWGFYQLEVKCVKDYTSIDYEVLWNFEFNQHPNLPVAPKGYIKTRFIWDILRIHHAMWSTNVGLIPDPDKFDHLASVALDWPLLRRGIAMCSWGDTDVKFFMFGNPAVWWISSLAMCIFPMLYIIYAIRNRRYYRDWTLSSWDRFNFISYITVGNWAIHFIPFLTMTRVLYVHHYFPSLYFACLATPYIIELCVYRASGNIVDIMFLSIALIIFVSFIYFSPFTYGFNYPGTDIISRRWLDSWDFVRKDQF